MKRLMCAVMLLSLFSYALPAWAESPPYRDFGVVSPDKGPDKSPDKGLVDSVAEGNAPDDANNDMGCGCASSDGAWSMRELVGLAVFFLALWIRRRQVMTRRERNEELR